MNAASRARGVYPVHRLSQRLELRELQADDADAVFAIYGSEAATEHLSFEPRTLDEVRQIVTRSIETAKATPRSESPAEPRWVSHCDPSPGGTATESRPYGCCSRWASRNSVCTASGEWTAQRT